MNPADYAAILINKAVKLAELGSVEAACSLLENALTVDSVNTVAMHRLAMIHAETGNHVQALELYQRIVGIMPENLDAVLLLGVEYAELGKYQEAIDCFKRCIAGSPSKGGLYQMLGVALAEIGRHDEAMEQFRLACNINPDDDVSLTHLAIEQIHFLKMADAEKCLLQALAINSLNALAYNNLGRTYKFQGRVPEAVHAFGKALALEPDNHVVVNNLLLSLNYLPDADPDQVAAEHRRLCRRVYGMSKGVNFSGQSASPHLPIRIGYVSGDFHNHSVSFFLEPVLQNHDPGRVRVYCYSNDTREDDTTRRLMACTVQWQNIAKVSDSDAAEMILNDGIDILIDLSGHSSENRLGLFALKPAPVQLSWLGYPHSTGLEQIDYYISDNFCDPPGMTERLFVEKLLRLPRIFSCYLPPLHFPTVVAPPSEASGVITFGSFNNFAKVNDKVIATWSEILNRVEKSRLLLKSMALGDPSTQQQVWAGFAQHGVPKERIALLSTVNSALEHLALYGQIDIALDTFPYQGTTTTCEALWMGVPVVTLAGKTHASRVGVSFLNTVGLSELIASSPNDYVFKAVSLAESPARLQQYRETIRTKMAYSPLMDAAGVTRELEDALCSVVRS